MIGVPSTVMNRWLSRDFELIGAVADMGSGLVDLWEASPVRLNSNEPNTDKVIDLLFPGNPLLCCGWTRHRFDTRARQHWHKLQDLQFIVPSPMTAKQGLTREGKLSAHASSNTGPRRFLIVEFDFDASNSDQEAHLLERLATEGRDVRDLCAALLLNLAEKAPLALAVHSGGKSLHGWFYCAGVPEQTVWCTFQYAVSLIMRIGRARSLRECQMDCGRTAGGKLSISSTQRWSHEAGQFLAQGSTNRGTIRAVV
jgi:hypothetical protein